MKMGAVLESLMAPTFTVVSAQEGVYMKKTKVRLRNPIETFFCNHFTHLRQSKF